MMMLFLLRRQVQQSQGTIREAKKSPELLIGGVTSHFGCQRGSLLSKVSKQTRRFTGCCPVIDNPIRTVIDNFIRTVIDNFNRTVIDNIFIETEIDRFLLSKEDLT
jgi:hypothetical protein